MFKHKYIVTYRVQPNKTTDGYDCARRMTLNGPYDSKEQEKVISILAALHRVNKNAIHILKYEQVGRELHLKAWLTKKVVDALKKAFAIVGTTRGGN